MTDYGDHNPLYYDYYGFSGEFYELKFESHGDSNLANRIVDLYNKVGDLGPLPALVTPIHILLGRAARQNYDGFRAPWHGWPRKNVFRLRSRCLYPIPTHVWLGGGHAHYRGFDGLEL